MAKISIPARNNAPATKLHIEIVSPNKNQLGKRPLVFILPGGPGAGSATYKQNYSCLVDVADLIFHDPRGCGLSAKGEAATYNMENYIDDVETIRKHLELDNIIVLGKSYGAIAAMGYALRYQPHIKKLIIAAGAPSYRFLATAKHNLKQHGTPQQMAICQEKLWDGKFNNAKEVMKYFKIMEPLYSDKVKAKTANSYLKKVYKNFNYEALNLGFSDFLRKFDYEPQLSSIKCPTLILAGANDWVNDITHSKLMAKKIPNSKLKIFPNSSHTMETDVTREYFATVRTFLA